MFRTDDPLLQVALAPEHEMRLRNLLDSLPSEIFVASDALGWVYQYWQSRKKDEINRSENKVGADEIPAVTQLFTEPYMVDFLLHNTLGAWWAGKHVTDEDLLTATSETGLRQQVSLPGIQWDYLRFIQTTTKNDANPKWQIAAGPFSEWPLTAKEIRVLDPCCGSGHFLVGAFRILVPMRMAEEGLTSCQAVDAVLSDNLHGLEIDNRCCQIAAFALALAAWSYPGSGGYRPLPELHLACSGIAATGSEKDWSRLAGKDDRLRAGMQELYKIFKEADTLGSLIHPKALRQEDLFAGGFQELKPLLAEALAREDVKADMQRLESVIAARGMAEAAQLLENDYTLVATNVPYLHRGKHNDTLRDYLSANYGRSRTDLATAMLERCLGLGEEGGAVAVVAPQHPLYLRSFSALRAHLLQHKTLRVVAALGPRAFQAISGEIVNVALYCLGSATPQSTTRFAALDANEPASSELKDQTLRNGTAKLLNQQAQLSNPDRKILLSGVIEGPLLEEYARGLAGICSGDYDRFGRCFWETCLPLSEWILQASTVRQTQFYGGLEHVFFWENGTGQFVQYVRERLGDNIGAWVRGLHAWNKKGIAVSSTGSLPSSLYQGTAFDNNTAVILPHNPAHLPAIWCFCSSPEYASQVRRIDKKLNVTNATLVKVPFDLEHWQQVARERYPHGLPKPQSNDPTQWLFHGHPAGMVTSGPADKSPYGIADPVGTDRHSSLICRTPNTEDILQVAVARLLGYRWPAETDEQMELDEASRAWVQKCSGLKAYADNNDIVCLPSVLGEEPAHERLLQLLVAAGLPVERLSEWTSGVSLDEWLRNTFFAQHCRLFRHRPFIWHIWDGRRRDGFHALVNYHKLCGENGKGRQLLERLTYSYLGDWLARQQNAAMLGEDGADERLAAAAILQNTLKEILVGEPPFDIFVRWKPLKLQPLGWEPDIDDGVRMNIRPFVAWDLPRSLKGAGILRAKPNIRWGKDRGKEPKRSKDDYPWFWGWDQKSQDFTGGHKHDGNRWNGCHYTLCLKRAARETFSG